MANKDNCAPEKRQLTLSMMAGLSGRKGSYRSRHPASIRASQPRKGMRRSLLAFLSSYLMQQAASQTSEVNQRTISCENSSPPLLGYDRMQDVVNDQQDEFDRIAAGQEPRPPYVFRLCPNTEFNTQTDPLNVLLDGIMVICGPNMVSSDNCVLKGGNEQIMLQDSTLASYPLNTASFVGLTFTGFGGTSVKAFASAGLRAMFVDCTWRDFMANFLVNLGVEVGAPAPTAERMRVEVSGGSLIQNGRGSGYFSNIFGTMVLDDVRFENVMGIDIIATSASGVTMLDGVVLETGIMETFAVANDGAAHTVINTTVSGLTRVNDIFSVRGAGTTMMMINTNMRNTALMGNSAFTGVSVQEGGTAEVKRSTFTGNSGVSRGFSVRGANSNLELIDVDMLGNTGIAGALTAVAYAEDSGQLTMRHVIFDNNLVFYSQVFGLAGATVDISMSCFNSGGGDTVLFFTETSVVKDNSNFMSSEMMSVNCRDARDGRLVRENDGAGCFDPQDSAPCSVGCQRFGSAGECGQTMAPTTTPSAAPTMPITDGPTVSPKPSADGGGDIGNGDAGDSGNGSDSDTGNGGNIGNGNGIDNENSGNNGNGGNNGNDGDNGDGDNGGHHGPLFSPFFMHPAAVPFFNDPPAFAPANANPAFAPASIPSVFGSPTCEPGRGLNRPLYYGPSYYRPDFFSSSGSGGGNTRVHKGKKGKGGKSKSNVRTSKSKGSKSHRGYGNVSGRSQHLSSWVHSNGSRGSQQHHQQAYAHHPNQHHPHQHHAQDPNLHRRHQIHVHNQRHHGTNQHSVRQHPILHYNPQIQSTQYNINQFENQVNFYENPTQQFPQDHDQQPNQQHYDPQSQKHFHSYTGPQVRHPRKGRIRRRRRHRTLQGVEGELKRIHED